MIQSDEPQRDKVLPSYEKILHCCSTHLPGTLLVHKHLARSGTDNHYPISESSPSEAYSHTFTWNSSCQNHKTRQHHPSYRRSTAHHRDHPKTPSVSSIVHLQVSGQRTTTTNPRYPPSRDLTRTPNVRNSTVLSCIRRK
jgi:hypothetical protein